MDNAQDKILFQFLMNTHVYRRVTVAVRVSLTVIFTGAACGLCALSVLIGISVAVAVAAVGAISVVVSLGDTRSYTVYNSRIVFKSRNGQRKVSVQTASIVDVKSTRAFYEKSFDVDTVTVTAKTKRGVRRYKLRHIFNSAPAVEYLKSVVEQNTSEANK